MLKTLVKKISWSDIKKSVKNLNQPFYESIESVSPSNDLALLKVQYPYGFKISDHKGFYLPDGYQNFLEGSGFDKSAPLSFVLENQVQYYLDTPHNHMPWRIHFPGDYYPTTVNVELENQTRFYPRSIFSVTAGIRDVTLLSLHGNTRDFYNLRHKYSIPASISPSNPLDHFEIFKRIINHEKIAWYSTVLVFSKEWQKKIYYDKKWWPLKKYLLENSLRINSFSRSVQYLDQAIYDITRSMDYKFRPHVHEIIRQLLFIAVGQLPGFRPATNNQGFPTKEVSEALKSSTRELLTLPVIMQASMMKPENRKQFIYNSISYNTSTKYDLKSTPNQYLSEIMLHLKEYLQHFQEHLITKGTVYDNLYHQLNVIPCSTRGSNKHNIKKCIEMYEIDKSFWHCRDTLRLNSRYGAPINAQFCKGFIGLKWKEQTIKNNE